MASVVFMEVIQAYARTGKGSSRGRSLLAWQKGWQWKSEQLDLPGRRNPVQGARKNHWQFNGQPVHYRGTPKAS